MSRRSTTGHSSGNSGRGSCSSRPEPNRRRRRQRCRRWSRRQCLSWSWRRRWYACVGTDREDRGGSIKERWRHAVFQHIQLQGETPSLRVILGAVFATKCQAGFQVAKKRARHGYSLAEDQTLLEESESRSWDKARAQTRTAAAPGFSCFPRSCHASYPVFFSTLSRSVSYAKRIKPGAHERPRRDRAVSEAFLGRLSTPALMVPFRGASSLQTQRNAWRRTKEAAEETRFKANPKMIRSEVNGFLRFLSLVRFQSVATHRNLAVEAYSFISASHF